MPDSQKETSLILGFITSALWWTFHPIATIAQFVFILTGSLGTLALFIFFAYSAFMRLPQVVHAAVTPATAQELAKANPNLFPAPPSPALSSSLEPHNLPQIETPPPEKETKPDPQETRNA